MIFGKTTLGTSSASARPTTAELSRLVLARVFVFSHVAIALSEWRVAGRQVSGCGVGGGSSSSSSGGCGGKATLRGNVELLGGMSGGGGRASHLAYASDMVQGALLAAEAALGRGRVAFPTTTVCSQALSPVHSLLYTEGAGGDDSVDACREARQVAHATANPSPGRKPDD